MSETFFEILRPGINTTIQDYGRKYLYHIGITVSGAMDLRNHKFANALVSNNTQEATIEFAYQGPLLKLKNGKINFAITGDVFFKILRKNSKVEEGKCYKNYVLEEEEQIDIISTKNSAYGYLAIGGGLKLKCFWDSYSINTKANIGPNNGKKLSINEKIQIKNTNKVQASDRKIDYKNESNNYIRVIKGTNFDYFSAESQSKFFKEEYSITNLTDRMGMRLKGSTLENIKSTNIKSEGLIKGVIQVPADGNPIILLNDHGTIGGYPKIAVVISADLDKVSQLTPNTKIKFKEVSLEDAENLFKSYLSETNKYLNEIN
tara:strand:- start:249 stop:1202 length:954 start_codon:yes stop_codon:yes gene_type:complete